MARNGVSENVAMAITGHQTRSVFDRYDISSEVDLADAAAKTEERNQQRNAISLSAKLQRSYNPPESGAVVKGPILH